MEIQLQELIDQIKKDGVEAAEAEAAAIIEKANAEAARIVAEAKTEADSIMLAAKNNNERTVKAGEDAIRQAGRNLLISFRESVNREAKAILSESVGQAYTPEALSALIMKITEAWTCDGEAEDISVLVSNEDLKALEESLLASLKWKMLNGVTLKASDNFDGGFRIAASSSGAYYDYSAEAVVEMLSDYLSPKITALLKEAEEA